LGTVGSSHKHLAQSLAVAVLATTLAYLALEPAVNNGDYARSIQTVPFEIGAWTSPDHCIPHSEDKKLDLVWGPLGYLVWVFYQATSGLLGGCFSFDLWFLFNSTVFWTGAFLSSMAVYGKLRTALVFLYCIHFFVFSPFFYSLYEEMLLFVLTPYIAMIKLRSPAAILLSMFVMAVSITTKAQSIFLAPLLVYMLASVTPACWRSRVVLFALVAVISSLYSLAGSYNQPNSYNRIFNGLGWADLEVSSWPVESFFERQDYFQEEIYTGIRGDDACSPQGYNLMGTSYWPMGRKILDAEAGMPKDVREFVTSLGFRDYFACLFDMKNPMNTISQVYAVSWISDYSLDYIVGINASRLGDGWRLAFSAVTDVLVPLAVALCVLLGLVVRSGNAIIGSVYLVIGSPVFVFIGDGFYEFERHMLVHVAFITVVASFAIRNRSPLHPRDQGRDGVQCLEGS